MGSSNRSNTSCSIAPSRIIENVMVGEFDNLCHPLSDLSRRLRLPLAQPGVQFLHQSVHGDTLPRIQFSAKHRF